METPTSQSLPLVERSLLDHDPKPTQSPDNPDMRNSTSETQRYSANGKAPVGR
jgi:hypothetical protein